MRGAKILIAAIGAMLGEIIRVAFPDIFKHLVYGHVADFLDRLVNSWWASVIASIVEHSWPAATSRDRHSFGRPGAL
jgi:hypothetical protein